MKLNIDNYELNVALKNNGILDGNFFKEPVSLKIFLSLI